MAAQTPPAAVPPNQAIKIVADGGISKLIIQEGTGAIPPLHSRCIGEIGGHYCGLGSTIFYYLTAHLPFTVFSLPSH